MKLDSLTVKFLGVLAGNRRLADLSGMIGAFDAIVAAHRGEVTAQVTSAHPLTAEQVKALTANLKTRVGRNRSEEHTSELQSLMRISYAVFCLKKKKHTKHYVRKRPQ